MRKEVIEIRMEDFEGDFECKCGNNSFSSGFFPCNENGEEVEPIKDKWQGFYICMECGKIYKIMDEK